MNNIYLLKLRKTHLTDANAIEVRDLAKQAIDKSKEQYGFVGKRWKPLVVSDGWVYQMKAEAEKIISRDRAFTADPQI